MRRHHHLIALALLAAIAAAVTTLALVAGIWTALACTAVGLTLALWRAAVGYSKRAFPFLPCHGCKGSGKDFEPIVLAWTSLRLHRAWRDCSRCSGSGKRDRRGR